MAVKSQSQRAWMHIHHPKMAKRWERETPKGKLPKHVSEASPFKVSSAETSPGTWAYVTSYAAGHVYEMTTAQAEDFIREAEEKTGIERNGGVVHVPNP